MTTKQRLAHLERELKLAQEEAQRLRAALDQEVQRRKRDAETYHAAAQHERKTYRKAQERLVDQARTLRKIIDGLLDRLAPSSQESPWTVHATADGPWLAQYAEEFGRDIAAQRLAREASQTAAKASAKEKAP